MTRTDDETTLAGMIHRWADAVHDGDLATVLEDHADDIVMFDVPPPEQGVRGIDAYRDSWPGFFAFQRAGGSFEIVELDVTAGADVAFAWALLRCASPEERRRRPEGRLRLTLGFRKHDDRWVVHHEHHSFTLRSEDG